MQILFSSPYTVDFRLRRERLTDLLVLLFVLGEDSNRIGILDPFRRLGDLLPSFDSTTALLQMVPKTGMGSLVLLDVDFVQ